MRKVIKSQTVSGVDDFVEIPDVADILTIEDPAETAGEDSGIPPGGELVVASLSDLLTEVNAEKERTLEAARLQAQQIRDKIMRMTNDERSKILAAAQSDAAKKIEDASKEGKRIVQQAHNDYKAEMEKARIEGFNEGVKRKAQDIEDSLVQIRAALQQLSEDHDEYMEVFAKELKWLALDIAQKVIVQKIDGNEMFISNILRTVLADVRDEKWVSVKVSAQLPDVVRKMIRQIAENEGIPQAEVHVAEDVHKGTCMLQFPDRVIDASVLTSLKNIEDYFKRVDDERQIMLQEQNASDVC
ncbi:MAG: hypothetical protein LBR54_02320 [Oscillospiraceae bacterium]|nr:hypothetical protein [Oscillospiraceae bacterium]